jgi:hypothetical protein
MISKMIGISCAQGIDVAVTSGADAVAITASNASRADSRESYSTTVCKDTVSSGTNFSIKQPASHNACLTRLGVTPNRAALTKSIKQDKESSALKFGAQDIIDFQLTETEMCVNNQINREINFHTPKELRNIRIINHNDSL